MTASSPSWVNLRLHYSRTPGAVVAWQDVQEIQRHKIEQKNLNKIGKKRGARRSCCSPHIANSQGGFVLSQGSQGEPLAWELKTGATQTPPQPWAPQNTFYFFVLRPSICCVLSESSKCKYARRKTTAPAVTRAPTRLFFQLNEV